MSKLNDLLKANPKDFMKILRGENEADLTDLEEATDDASDKKGKKGKKQPSNRIASVGLQPYVATLPSVNMIPLEVEESYVTKKIARKFFYIGAAVVVVLAVTGGVGLFLNTLHQSTITEMNDEASAIQSQISEKQPYQGYQSEVADERTTLASQLQTDVNIGAILNSLNNLSEASGVTLDSVNIAFSSAATTTASTATADTSSCTNPDPFGSVSSIGCITLSGKGATRDGVNSFFNTIDTTQGFSNSFISSVGSSSSGGSSANAAPDGVGFQGTVSITEFFRSGRFTELASPLEQILNPAPAQGTDTGTEQGSGEQASTGDTTLDAGEETILASTLQQKYPNIFGAAVTDDKISKMATDLCSGVVSNSLSDVDAYGNTIASAIGVAVSAEDAATITSDTVETVCSAGMPNLKLGVEQ